ncbi:type II CRISPR-associated endonuclease Cas1 [Sulfurimonas sediminis]|uniref:CRISPR-associated endonuclease Cas1 n=1 Tax=Sulfurimonas sediminis TaxID=2590020 RepID=A0A7M1AY92_9BACT|nr:type II CRISPR-associated endonuclease Cas1 [Sulfurimonas sediminis]QOP42433.1 type II CRISPR-associated endonuclease Cas1 [Sulfurimonas sediminis]
MGFKVLHLTRPCKIKIQNANMHLYFYDDANEVKVTLRDIDFLLFDNTQFSITGATLQLLAQSNIATLFIDEVYHPCAILTPYHQHSTMSEIAHAQVSLDVTFKSKSWQNIIISKVKNQAEVLAFMSLDTANELREFAKKVTLYDANQDEAQAARLYWKSLFNMQTFRREQGSEDIVNVMLNYVYAIVRACIARDVSVSGMLPVFGIWHKNKYNAFALVDDLMEPFRPVCDLYVKLLLNKKYHAANNLSTNIKRDLIAILNKEYLIINDGVSTVITAIGLFVREYKKSMMMQSAETLIFPRINTEKFYNEFF